MKLLKLFGLSLIVYVVLLAFYGCSTTQQTTALNTLGTLEATATTAVDQYDAQVIKGTISTNSFAKVQKAYNDFQAGMVLAVTLVQNNTNALAPPNLVQEASELVNLINTAK
jgi:hypothetical protein